MSERYWPTAQTQKNLLEKNCKKEMVNALKMGRCSRAIEVQEVYFLLLSASGLLPRLV